MVPTRQHDTLGVRVDRRDVELGELDPPPKLARRAEARHERPPQPVRLPAHDHVLGLSQRGEAVPVGTMDPEVRRPQDPWQPPKPTREHRVIGTVSPTQAQIREWAYDVDLWLTAQVEHAALMHIDALPLLFELAEDPDCPKRAFLLSLVARMVLAIDERGLCRALMSRMGSLARRSSSALCYRDKYLPDGIVLGTKG